MSKYKIKRQVEVEKEVSYAEYVAFKLTELRKDRGWTQQQLGDKTGLSRTSIAHIEKNHRDLMLKNLYLMCEVFGVKSRDILPF